MESTDAIVQQRNRLPTSQANLPGRSDGGLQSLQKRDRRRINLLTHACHLDPG
jgi:hypothetical protein